jgi:hypothetical protein
VPLTAGDVIVTLMRGTSPPDPRLVEAATGKTPDAIVHYWADSWVAVSSCGGDCSEVGARITRRAEATFGPEGYPAHFDREDRFMSAVYHQLYDPAAWDAVPEYDAEAELRKLMAWAEERNQNAAQAAQDLADCPHEGWAYDDQGNHWCDYCGLWHACPHEDGQDPALCRESEGGSDG